MYNIYRLVGPTGRNYIGCTKMSIKERWRHHVRRAFHELSRRELYEDIRVYGPEAFRLEMLATALDKTAGHAKEAAYIALEEGPYNLSPGGAYDAVTGNTEHWRLYREDPVYRERYRQQLSLGCSTFGEEANQARVRRLHRWQEDNPRARYYIARRASRVAAKLKPPRTPEPELPLKERLFRKFKNGEFRSQYITKMWAERDEATKAGIFEKIGGSNRAGWAAIEDPEERSARTAAARAAIDRSKQGPAASKGIKNFWAELRKDPEAYKAYMERRTASMMVKQRELMDDPERWAEVVAKRQKTREAKKKKCEPMT